MSKVITVKYVGYDIPNDLQYQVMAPRATVNVNAIKAIKALEGGYVPVAEIEYDDKLNLMDNLEYAYKILQNGVVTDSWTLMPPDGLKALVDPIERNGQTYGHRSASMGDIFIVDGKEYVVATYGFEELK
jgi:hypothetical protein